MTSEKGLALRYFRCLVTQASDGIAKAARLGHFDSAVSDRLTTPDHQPV